MHDFLAEFAADAQFLKLLTRRDDEVDLTVAALELARDAEPDLDFTPTLKWIADRGGELSGPLAHAASDTELLEGLGECLRGGHGLVGNAECYEQAESSFLNRVIERKTGLPIALSVLYMAVAGRAGLDLEGVGAPIHFLTRYETLDDPLFLDAFAGGQVLSLEQCLNRVQETSGLSADEALAALAPVGTRTIITRMLNNLKALYARQEDWPACWRVQQRLLALHPGAFHERRDWALLAVRTGRSSPAIDMLESCLATCPADERATLESQLAEARKSLARWN
ncbi:MAG: tetratricopeptide repeat protein [Planctomycetaceae bacterium]|nr:tetratricopeptide repeat protein [Planctomycetaceae bacterium]